MTGFAKFALIWIAVEFVVIGVYAVCHFAKEPERAEPGLVIALCHDATPDFEDSYREFLRSQSGAGKATQVSL